MSEYQCYEFAALDRPLTPKQMAELRAVSTRAEISPTRFWNEYQWGDLKADPTKLVERYFDAHLYFANWGSHRLMLRFPLARVDTKALRAYFVGDVATARRAGEHLILDLQTEDEEGDEYEYEDSPGSLAALAPLRAEVMRGDLRVAYLAWLLAVQSGAVREKSVEPEVPRGLSELTAAQTAMVRFLRIDEDLISAAAEGSDQVGGRRTVAQLLAASEMHRERRERAENSRKEKAKRAAETARTKRLDALAKRLDDAWTKLEGLVAKSAYEEAVKLASDLSDLAKRDGASGSFNVRFKAMRKRQLRRRGFFDRWKRQNEPR